MSVVDNEKLVEVAKRIREMREISGFSVEEMAEKTEVTVAEYKAYENGSEDFPFTFIHKCALAFGLGITDILEGESARLKSYTVTRRGGGRQTAEEEGISIVNVAPMFKNKIAEPYFCQYDYNESLQNKPIHLTKHAGQEFDYVISGKMKIQIGNNFEELQAGDSIYYNSSTPHGMIAIGGEDVKFIAIILPGEKEVEEHDDDVMKAHVKKKSEIASQFVRTLEDEDGCLKAISFKNEDKFNFAFDCVDAIANNTPEKLAMLHIDKNKVERRFTFNDMKRRSNQTANYFKSLGIKKGDRVMLVLKRHYQFWFSMLALHKLGAIAIPATNQLLAHDFEYRFQSAGVSAIVATADGAVADSVDEAQKTCPTLTTKVLVGGQRDGWRDFDAEYEMYSTHYYRTVDTPCGNDTMVMFFTSGTTGYPKIANHSYKYALGHYVTAKYWHGVDPDGLHFTISDTGWGKALWGKLYGQWLSEGAVFTYDFDRFHADDILPMFKKYHITTFCAPPTMLRMMIKEDLSKYDLSSIVHMTTAGEALNPEVWRQFRKATGLRIMEGFGQTETTLTIGNLFGTTPKLGSMGKPIPGYDIDIVDPDGNPVPDGEPGEIIIRTDKRVPCGLFKGYYRNEEATHEAWHDGMYQAIPRGVMRTATSGMSDVPTTLSNPPATVSDRSRSNPSSWNCRMCLSAAYPRLPMRCAVRSSRRVSSSSRARSLPKS